MSLGLNFSDMWAAAVAFMGGDMLKPMVMSIGGLFIAFLAISLLIKLVWGNK